MANGYTINVNGTDFTLDLPGDTPLLYVLRNDLGLNGPKYGCGLAQCGTCSVEIDGQIARVCVLPLKSVVGRKITTLEGLGDADGLHIVQQAFVDCQAAQCGYCLNGMILTTKVLLDHNPAPSTSEIKKALQHNLCRCGAHYEILEAVNKASKMYQLRNENLNEEKVTGKKV